ncbi:MAG: hypothetical protein OSA41_05630 [Erythrobacter sp.]|jgi:hypothetical protein|nr:hypothetical protein [Verrucomicrobiales bacterium]MDE0901178.1 hypothetical protein [Erythrobacter sp.]|tara:strand:- start:266919 stop:267593 length:675 start_codon:yes stop_codon:yes gene_type:complete
MAGEVTRTPKSMRHPLDWCVEQGWEWDMILGAIGAEPELGEGVAIWDPCAGFGHSGSRLEGWGFTGRIYLSDLVENVAWDDFHLRPTFFLADFLTLTEPPKSPISVFFNPPFSYIDGIWEDCVRHALKLATHRVVAIAPLKYTAGGLKRGKLFRFDHPPQLQLIFTQRPSMPPGDMIAALGKDAYRKGQIDYCAFVWDVREPTQPGETRTVWLPRFDDPIEGIT